MRLSNRAIPFVLLMTAIHFGIVARGERPLLDDAERAAAVARFRNTFKEGKVLRSESRRFNLTYELDGIASDKLYRVELWGTDDLGRTWKLWGHDSDNASPLEAETMGNGVYGFLIDVRLKASDAGRTPKRGQDADIWINVEDSTSVLTNMATHGLHLEFSKRGRVELASKSVDVAPVAEELTNRIERRRWRFFRRRF